MKSLIFVLTVFTVGSLFARDFSDFNVGAMDTAIKHEKKEFSGTWPGGAKWKGFLCEGEYKYKVKVRTFLDDFVSEAAPEGKLSLKIDFVDLEGAAFGSFRASELLCIPFHLGIDLFIDRISVRAKASLIEKEGDSKVVIRILSTKLGQIHFKNSVAPSLEKFITRLVNEAFQWLWNSQIGEWISDKISDEFNKSSE